jgi:cysteine desulfurase
MAIYLDCAATTPIDPRVQQEVELYLGVEFGNAGSRSHDYGVRARRAVEQARDQVAAVVGASRSEVIFTSGATESNNLAILGLAEHGRTSGKMHLVATQIEHSAVLEPLQALVRQGFTVTYVPPTRGGWVEPRAIRDAVRDDTLLVTVMQVNNETGVRQPVEEIAEFLGDHPTLFQVDAAQGFGKELQPLRNRRIDLISISGHKIFAPKGVGALVLRRRHGQRPPLIPLMYGGGQELGLRPGTLPVHLIVGLGKAAELALEEAEARAERCRQFKDRLLRALRPLEPAVNGDPARTVPYMVNLSFPGIDAEEAMEAVRDVAAISNGAACTTQSRTCSHVLAAMQVEGERAAGALRFSWCHMTEEPDWTRFIEALHRVRVP